MFIEKLSRLVARQSWLNLRLIKAPLFQTRD